MKTSPSPRTLPLVVGILAAVLGAFGQAVVRYSDWGNRFEGQRETPHAAPNYELRGFFAYREDYPLAKETRLRVRFFVPPEESAAFLEAQEVNEEKQYHMEPKDGSFRTLPGAWSEFAPWPVKDVLLPLGLTPEKLAVVVHLRTPSEYGEELAPAVLYESQFPREVKNYTVYWSSTLRLKQLEYGIYGGGPARPLTEFRQQDGSTMIEPEQVVHLHIDAGGLAYGWCTIRLRGRYVNRNDPLLAEYRFYHKGRLQ
jgi:hypothetical protein